MRGAGAVRGDRKFRASVIHSTALRFAGLGLLLLMHIVVGRWAGPEGLGLFSYVLAFVGLAGLVVTLGWPVAVTRFAAQYLEAESWSLLKGSIRRAIQVALFGSLLGSLALVVASVLPVVPANQRLPLAAAAALLPLTALITTQSKTLQGLGYVRWSIALEDVTLPVLVIGAVVALGLRSAPDIFLAYGTVATIVVVGGAWGLRRVSPPALRTAVPEYQTRSWMVVAVPMLAGLLSQMLLNRTDVLMLGGLSTFQEVGLYNAAGRIAKVNVAALGAISAVATPRLAAAWYAGRRDEFRRTIVMAMRWSTAAALPVAAVSLMWPGPLLGLYGPDFTAGITLLRVLTIGQFVNAATGPVGHALLMSGRERHFALSLGVVAALNVVGNAWAIPRWGGVGAAWVTAGCVVVLNCWQMILVWIPRQMAVSTDSDPGSGPRG